MLRIIQNTSVAGAKSYYTSANMADYYTEGQELAGIWRGRGAKRLGLCGKVEQEAWEALCDNRDPATGLTLTSRRKSERRVGYDFNFHVPKSVSLLYALSGDQRIVDAFGECVNSTMEDMEALAMTRVRKGGKNEDRLTGNMVWGEFVHFTSRPVNGVPCPHLHAHCFCMNFTFDDQEDRWKAGVFAGIKRDAPYFEAVFHARLARKMAELGLPVQRTRTGWEIAGIGRSTLAKFSRRTALIEKTALELEAKAEKDWQTARAQGQTAEKKRINKFELGATTRERKQKNRSMDELRQEWRSRLSDGERSGLLKIAESVGGPPIPENLLAARESAALAIDHCFYANSVVPERILLAEALKRSVGQTSAAMVEGIVREQNIIVGEHKGRRMATTSQVLAEEKRMLAFARRGRGSAVPLQSGAHVFQRDWLNAGQRNAVHHVLHSTDRVTLIRGAAGVGKTSMMQEAVEAIEAGGMKVFTFAPSTNASRGVLREEGFAKAETVAMLLTDEKLQKQTQGQVWWIDEAGLMGSRTMAQVFDLAEKLDARIILSGDTRQHGSVEHGAALRLLETETGIVSAEIKSIQRQSGAYKAAVQALSEGRVTDGFGQLDKLGWIQEVSNLDRYKILAREYVATVAKGKSALVVSPTHREAQTVTDQIRSELRCTPTPFAKDNQFMLGREQRQFLMLDNTHLTAAQRRDALNYTPGSDVLVFHQNAKGYVKGERVPAAQGTLPLDQADKFSVFHAGRIPIAPGEQLRITQNGKTLEGGHRLNNGAIFTVKGFTAGGDIRLTNGWTVAKDFGFLQHGYVVTSHASQGRTVDRVLIAESAQSFPAASAQQFYVSVSRARRQATIFTDDKKALLEAVKHSDDRLSATEFLASQEHRDRSMAMQRMQRQLEPQRESVRDRSEERIIHER
ncbi:MAG: relaxase domain-containing protein [Planctomycetota bacterium]|nr:relaxase domain-containing protein [Planctomycetota bacterium]